MTLSTAPPAPIRADGAFDHTLWARLSHMTFDESGAVLPFSARLARENGWSKAFALRVVEEYRRFLYLARRAGHPVTPSDEVDQAWHLHMLYSRHYWDVLCGEILGKPLHHGPTLGGREEAQKFADWYTRTLDAYRRLFGEEPPADIWPPRRRRFGGRYRRIDLRDCWVIAKPALRWPSWTASVGMVAAGLAGAAALLAHGAAEAATRVHAAANDTALPVVALAAFLLIIGFTRSLAAATVGTMFVAAAWSASSVAMLFIVILIGLIAMMRGGSHLGYSDMGQGPDESNSDGDGGGGDGGGGGGDGGCGGGCGGCGGCGG
jgi:hypothetical protein